MKFKPSGVPRESGQKRPPGTLLGDRVVQCAYCGCAVKESEARTKPPGAGPGTPRLLLCADCGPAPTEEDACPQD